jgi:AcrR family transcriptional regulator
MTKTTTHNTEELILDAAKDIFQHKGMDGARMQEIADKAGINKAMLHYYYRSKQKLFEAVFKSAINLMAPKIADIINTEEHLFDKIKNFTNKYIGFISKHSYIPLFIINELNRNPELLKDVFKNRNDNQIEQKLVNQINELVEKGEIRPINPEQLLLDIMSLSIFPVVGQSLLKTLLQKDDKEYKKLIKQRKTCVAEFVINSIKIK